MSLQNGLDLVTLETEQTGVGVNCGGISFGQLPYLQNVAKRTISTRITPTTIDAATNSILSMEDDNAGWGLYLDGGTATPKVCFIQKAGTEGIWCSRPIDSVVRSR